MAKVFLGMSGGVDSAASAYLLKQAGHDVHAIYMRNWSKDLPGFACPWAKDLADAERVCYTLGIPLDVWDYEAEYKKTVVDYLLDAYAKGYTPNPDVMCNQTIKFGAFLDRALTEGADFIATGHYARVSSEHKLLRSREEHKDQTYFLWRVDEKAFEHVLFPVGDFSSKAEVRALVAEAGLDIASKQDSDGICFIGPVGIRNFLLSEFERKAGPIIEIESGRELGQHDGAFLFTLGQRKGLALGGGPARYVVATDIHKNIVYVSANKHHELLFCHDLELEDCHFFDDIEKVTHSVLVRTRHTGKLAEATLEPAGEGQVRVHFAHEHEAVAGGQSVVIYDGERVYGGGIARGRFLDAAK